MSSEEISLIASDRFIQKFVYAIVQNIRARNFVYEEKNVIHADLVPRISEKVVQASLREKTTAKIDSMPVPVVPPIVPTRRGFGVRGFGVSGNRRPMPPQRMFAPRVAPPMSQRMAPPVQQIAPPNAPQEAPVALSQDYGKITPLLNDPSVSTIECPGAGRALMIIRAGQKQGTKISLSAEEIKEILQKVSDAVHIPLLEGVFRAAVDNFSINAVISEMIGSRFVIKKQTAYALLEGKA